MEEIKEEWPKYYAWFKASGMHQAPDMIRGIENFWLAKLSSSQLSIIQAIDEWAEKHANEYKGDGLNGRREDIYKMFSDDLRSFLKEAKTKLQ